MWGEACEILYCLLWYPFSFPLPAFSKLWDKLKRLWWLVRADHCPESDYTRSLTELFQTPSFSKSVPWEACALSNNLSCRRDCWNIYMVLFACTNLIFPPNLTSFRSFISTVYFLIVYNQLIQSQTLSCIFLYLLWNEQAELKSHMSFTRNKVLFTLLAFWTHLFLLKSIKNLH